VSRPAEAPTDETGPSGARAGTAQLTVLNGMASRDFDQALSVIKSWGLEWVDLWGSIYGQPVDGLSSAAAERAAAALGERGLRAYCLSSRVFDDSVEQDEQVFRAKHLGTLRKALAAAAVLRPRYVRLIAGKVTGTAAEGNRVALLRKEHPWVREVYAEAVDLIAEAGFEPTIENEHQDCFLSTVDEYSDFFEWLGAPSGLTFTWDIVNAWKMGVYPTVEVYRALRPLLGYVHVKGGQADEHDPARLRWNVGLDESSWPVREVLQAVVDDGVSPVICLNPAHGEWKPGYDYGDGSAAATPNFERNFAPVTERDINFLRKNVGGIVQ